MVKQKTRGKKQVVAKCPHCSSLNIRRKGIQPTNPQASSKGWRNSRDEKFYPEAVTRLFTKRYVCQNCKKGFNYGNAGRPIL